MTFTTGSVLDSKYRLLGKLGEGASGAVYLAENVRIGRRVAVKILRPSAASDAAMVERFALEARAAAQIGSAHIVEVLDSGEHDGCPYLVMEHLAGESLAERLSVERRMSPERASLIAIQILDGLSRAHAAGVVHRDLKPENVFLVRKGAAEVVKILDFGVSKFEHAQNVTIGDSVLGTPAYMSPEQARGKRSALDHRADLYSVGVLLYECVSGRLPVEGESVQDMLFKVALEPPVPLEDRLPGVDPTFASLVRRALARSPDDRFSSAAEMAEALRAFRRAAVGEDEEAEEMVRLALSMSADDWSSISAVREQRKAQITLGTGDNPLVRSLPPTVPPAAAQAAPRRPAVGKPLAAGSLALVVACALFAARASLLSRPVPSAPPLEAPASSPTSPTSPRAAAPSAVPSSAPRSPAAAGEPAAAPDEAVPARVVHVETFPPGAAVLLDQGTLLCPRTPCDITLATRDEVRLSLSRMGHEPATRLLTPQDRSVTVRLRPWDRDAPSPAAPSRAGAVSPKGDAARKQSAGFKPDPYGDSSPSAGNPAY